jgi:DNA-binding NarL/FixJ family response regulator
MSVPLLSERQQQVLALIADGWPNKTIAHALGISEATVKSHVTVLMRRLGVCSRTEAALRHRHDPDQAIPDLRSPRRSPT